MLQRQTKVSFALISGQPTRIKHISSFVLLLAKVCNTNIRKITQFYLSTIFSMLQLLRKVLEIEKQLSSRIVIIHECL